MCPQWTPTFLGGLKVTSTDTISLLWNYKNGFLLKMSPRYITHNLDPFWESLVSHTRATPVSIQVATNDSGLILTHDLLSRL